MENKHEIFANFLKLSAFAALAIFATVATVIFFAQVVAAGSCVTDTCSCDVCDTCGTCGHCDTCDYCDSCDHDYCDCDTCDTCECGPCTERYLDSYRCDGNKRQRLWINMDCSTEWKTIQICADGCRDGKCGICFESVGEVTLSKPSEKYERETISTTIKIRNTGDIGQYFDIRVYVCESGCGTSCGLGDCSQMVCEDNHVLVGAGDTEFVKCSRYISESGYYRIKVVYSAECSGIERTLYSEKFRIYDYYDSRCSRCGDPCDEEYGEYRCFGDFLQRRYLTDDCEWRWEIVEDCQYGCEDDRCVLQSQTQTTTQGQLGEPKIFMPTHYKLEKCEISSFTFSIQNNGETDAFDIDVEGPVGNWIDVPEMVEVEEGDTKRITGYANIPCAAEAGLHEFTIKVDGKTSDARDGFIKIERPKGLLELDPFTAFLLLILILVVFVVAFFYRDRFVVEERIERINGRIKEKVNGKINGIPDHKKPEAFINNCKIKLQNNRLKMTKTDTNTK